MNNLCRILTALIWLPFSGILVLVLSAPIIIWYSITCKIRIGKFNIIENTIGLFKGYRFGYKILIDYIKTGQIM